MYIELFCNSILLGCVPYECVHAVAVCVATLYLQVASQTTFDKCYTVGDNIHCFLTNGVDDKSSWHDAHDYCARELKGSYSLVAVDDMHVQIALENFMDLSDFVHNFVWLGINQTTRGKWLWVDGTPYTGARQLVALHATIVCA